MGMFGVQVKLANLAALGLTEEVAFLEAVLGRTALEVLDLVVHPVANKLMAANLAAL